MKWEKYGQIFDFHNSPFKEEFVSHAQSPQAVVFDHFIRIYFSTRKNGENGRFISHVQYIDYNKDFSRIINYSDHVVLPPSKLGCFDEHGIFPFSPVRVENNIYAYTSGWTQRVSVDTDSGIGLAISEDNGGTFQRIGDGPVLSASLHEPFLVIDGFVRQFNSIFYMFYIYGIKWSENTPQPERVYKIAYATSHNGIDWQRNSRCIITDVINEDECQALPTVIKIKERYHMFFCYRDMLGFRSQADKGYSLGYASSSDLINWERSDKLAGIKKSSTGWDSEMMCYPHLFKVDENIYLLYNGNEFGKYGFGLAKLEEI